VARIRSVKPDFWQRADVCSATHLERLLLLGLANLVDDAGRTRIVTRAIVGALFPCDADVDEGVVERGLRRLADLGAVVLYDAAGGRYVQVCGWGDDQVINRPSPSRCPPPPVSDHGTITEKSLGAHGESVMDARREPAAPNDDHGALTETSRSTHPGREGRGEERRGGEGEERAPADDAIRRAGALGPRVERRAMAAVARAGRPSEPTVFGAQQLSVAAPTPEAWCEAQRLRERLPALDGRSGRPLAVDLVTEKWGRYRERVAGAGVEAADRALLLWLQGDYQRFVGAWERERRLASTGPADPTTTVPSSVVERTRKMLDEQERVRRAVEADRDAGADGIEMLVAKKRPPPKEER
jgi:hypothetical protein